MSVDLPFSMNDDFLGTFSEGQWLGRCFVPESQNFLGKAGPLPIYVTDGKVYFLPNAPRTTSEIISGDMESYLSGEKVEFSSLKELFENSLYYQQDETKAYLLAPCDLQAVKACGVTFASSLIERVIEEKAGGNPHAAEQIRKDLIGQIGDDLADIEPGSKQSEVLKAKFQELGLWSQYLEVGIGPDAEVFTKSQVLSSIGFGAKAGLHPTSSWNNPEPEVVLAVSNTGEVVGATLGNDVNLRDVEGRSALLLGKAKDQNGSCVVGPLIRLFDKTFSMSDVESAEVQVRISGEDKFEDVAVSNMAEISRSPENLASQVLNDSHQYPDGFVLFLGTMFAPITDREGEGMGFTHKYGDRVEISTKKLGCLVNWMDASNNIPKWEFGISQLFHYLR
ncbi:MAG: fumarylacetoacetate hydrolase family protein [Lentisphaeraceae bacterium]|nr:fumarylacetoacetate hydrolase family protein [Lentisphaeraceae bacterium]